MVGRRANKYKAQKTVVDGITFDSRKEARRYGELKLLEKLGEIKYLELQPKIKLEIGGVPIRYASGRRVSYIGDFRYFDVGTGRFILEDVKGFENRVFKIKQAILLAMGIELVLIK